MGFGYGSEFHLLRWLGRHRNEFDRRVKETMNLDNVFWLDFKFNSKDEIPDKEIIGLEFLDENKYPALFASWRKEWPQTGNSMNWDLVGYTEIHGKKTWILVEAKAHLSELKQSCKAKNESLKKIQDALIKVNKNNDITPLEINSWTKKYYQLANRIYIIDLLRRHDIDAILLNIYFVGDMRSKNRISPQNIKEWEKKIFDMKNYLRYSEIKSIQIKEMYLDIDK